MRGARLKDKVLSGILALSIVVGSLPVVSVSAEDGQDEQVESYTKPVKEDDPLYKPEFSYDKEYFDDILDKTQEVHDLGKLPTLEEFQKTTGYELNGVVMMSQCRSLYGKGENFKAPAEKAVIYVNLSSELDLLSSLINGTAEDESEEERLFYNTATYKLVSDIDYQGQYFQPIGMTSANAFKGVFDGNGHVIHNLTIKETSGHVFDMGVSFGLFGVIGEGGKVSKVGLDLPVIDLPYTIGAAVGGICGINYGTIDGCYVTSGKLTDYYSTYSHSTDYRIAYDTTSFNVSNATVGGICAENYGTVSRVFTDVRINAKNTDAAYTVQPVVAINKGSVDKSYFIKYEMLTHIEDSTESLFKPVDNSVKEHLFPSEIGLYGSETQPSVYNNVDVFIGYPGEVSDTFVVYEKPLNWPSWMTGRSTDETKTVYDLDSDGNKILAYEYTVMDESADGYQLSDADDYIDGKPVKYTLDDKGNKIPKKDDKGNPVYLSHQEKVVEYDVRNYGIYHNYNGTAVCAEDFFAMSDELGLSDLFDAGVYDYIDMVTKVENDFDIDSFAKMIGRSTYDYSRYAYDYSLKSKREESDINKKAKQVYDILNGEPLVINLLASSSSYGSQSYQLDRWFKYIANCVNGNFTEYEQKLMSTAVINFKGSYFSFYGSHHDYAYSYMGTDYIPIGTEEHPFNGVFNGCGNTISIPNILSGDYSQSLGRYEYYERMMSSGVTPLFGCIGTDGQVIDLGVSIGYTAGYDVIPLSDTDVNIIDGVRADKGDAIGILCDINKGTIKNVLVQARMLIDEQADYQQWYLIAKDNQGTIDTAKGYGSYEFSDGSTDAVVMQGVGSNSGSLSEIDIQAYIKDCPWSKDKKISDDVTGVIKSGYSLQYSECADEKMTAYPSFKSAVMRDENGVVHIKTAEDFIWLLSNGTGEQAVLDKTIDMTGFVISRSYSGSFTLDGTLKDENDMCSYIDMGTGTKCYGILNLSMNDYALSSCDVTIKNVYFIGGSVSFNAVSMEYDKTFNRYSDDFDIIVNGRYIRAVHETAEGDIILPTHTAVMPLYGREIENVHSSVDIEACRSRVKLRYYYDYFGSQRENYSVWDVYPVLSLDAVKSTHSGVIRPVCTSGGFKGIGLYASECTSWASVKFDNSALSYCDISVYGVGGRVERSTSHLDVMHMVDADASFAVPSGCYAMISAYGLGYNCHECVLEGDYSFDNGNCLKMLTRPYYNYTGYDYEEFWYPASRYYLYGYSVTNCVFRGSMKSRYVDGHAYGMNYMPHICNSGTGFIVDKKAVIEGSYRGAEYTNGVLFAGTANLKSTVDAFYAIGLKCENAVNIGTINIDASDLSSPYTIGGAIYGMGVMVNGDMNGTINYLNTDDLEAPVYKYVYYYGIGSGRNYTDVIISDSMKTFGGAVFMRSSDAQNYGNIRLGAVTAEFSVASGCGSFRNFADVTVDKTTFVAGKFYVVSGSTFVSNVYDSVNSNYKDDHVSYSNNRGTVYYYGRNVADYGSWVPDGNINYGNINITLGSSDMTVCAYYYDSLYYSAYVNGERQPIYYRNINAGDISVQGKYNDDNEISGAVAVYGCRAGDNYGDLSVKDVRSRGDISFYGATFGNYAKISADNLSGKFFRVYSLYTDSHYNLDTTAENSAPWYNAHGRIDVQNCDFADGAYVRAACVNGMSSSYLYTRYWRVDADCPINIKDTTFGNGEVYVTGGVFTYRNTTWLRDEQWAGDHGLRVKTDIMLDNITAKNLHVHGAFERPDTRYYSRVSDGSLTDTQTVSGRIILKNSSFDQYNNESLHIYSVSSQDGAYALLDNDVDIIVDNCTMKGDMIIGNTGIKGPFASDGDISVTDVTARNMYISGISSDILSGSGIYTGDILVKNVNTGILTVNGVASTYGNLSDKGEVHHFGKIEVIADDDSNSFKNLYVSGVCDKWNGNNLTTNAGDIVIKLNKFSDDIDRSVYVAGITRTTNDFIFDAVNKGNISLTSDNSDKISVNIAGITPYSKNVQSVINWGDIDANIKYSSVDIVPEKTVRIDAVASAGTMDGWMNYGEVKLDTNVSDKSGFISDAVFADEGDFGINYGKFNWANVDESPVRSVRWYVDMTGNKDTIQDAYWTYVKSDKSVSGVKNKDYKSDLSSLHSDLSMTVTDMLNGDDVVKYYNNRAEQFLIGDPYYSSYEAWAENYNKVYASEDVQQSIADYEDTLNNISFDYDDMLDPAFAFIYCNPIAVKYETIDTKEEYYGNNVFTVADMARIIGDTGVFLKKNYSGHDRGIVMAGSQYYKSLSGTVDYTRVAGVLDRLVEDICGHEFDSMADKIVSTSNGNMTFNVYKQCLDQLDNGSSAVRFFHDIKIATKTTYPTTDGTHTTLENVSSLLPYQAPIDGDDDGEFSKNILVSVADLYVPLNKLDIAKAGSVDFDLSVYGSDGMTFKMFKTPIVFDNYAKAADYLKTQLADEDLASFKRPVKDGMTFSVKMPELKQSNTAIVGMGTSEDGTRHNILVLNIYSVDKAPGGYPTVFSYATGVNDSETSLTFTDFFANTGISDETKFDDSAKYTVEKETASNSLYKNYEYPVYTMSSNMWHTTDGKYSSGNSIVNTGDVQIAFNANDIDTYHVTIDVNGSTYDSGKKSMPNVGTASFDGVKTMKVRDTVSLYSLISSIDMTKNTSKNPFAAHGYKTVTVSAVLPTGEDLILFRFKFVKDISDENYIKSNIFNRYDNSTRFNDGVSVNNVSVGPVYFNYSFMKNYSPTVSALAGYYTTFYYLSDKPRDDDFSDYHKFGDDTYYPTKVSSELSVYAESGQRFVYKHVFQMPAIDSASISDIRSSGGLTYPMSAKNPLLIMDAGVSKLDLSVYYKDVLFTQSYNNQTVKSTIKKIYVYQGDELVDTVTDGVYKNMQFSLAGNSVRVIQLAGFNRTQLPDEVLTFVPVIAFTDEFTLKLDGFSIAKELLNESRILQASWQNTIGGSVISTSPIEMTEEELIRYNSIDSYDIDIYSDGVIDYTNTPDSANHFYIRNAVVNTCTSDVLTLKIPRYSTIYKKSGDAWMKLGSAGAEPEFITDSFKYDADKLGKGVVTDYMVTAQNYKADDERRKNFVSYYTMTITAKLRNKSVSIVFADDAVTQTLYKEILQNYGNTAIQIKNMNGDITPKVQVQQTKLYRTLYDNVSTYYQLAQGDYAIDVQVPDEYEPVVRIVGSSSEGYLRNYTDKYGKIISKGRRLRLPMPNTQNIQLEVYLAKKDTELPWGVTLSKSLFEDVRLNQIG